MSKSTVGTIVMGLFVLAIMASFALADVQSYIGGGLGAQGTLVKVGDQAVTERELSAALQRRLTEIRQQNPTAEYSALAGDFPEMLNALVQNKALLSFANKHELVISKRLVDAEIVKLPGTRGLDGKFSEAAYQSFLQQQKLTDQQVRELLATSLATRLLLAPVAANSRIPVGVATPYASMLLEAREAEIAIVPAQAFAAGIPQPGDADIQAYYKQNLSRYMVPEQRVLNIARIGPEQVANVTATEQEIVAFYNANQAQYGGKGLRSLTQAIVQDEAQARTLAQRARAGQGLGPTAATLANKTRDQIADINEGVAAAVFSAKEGDVVGPLRSDLGWHVVKVDKVSNQAGTPLSAVRGEIAANLTAEKRKGALADLVARIEDSIADGASFAEAIKGTGVSAMRTPAITGGGVARAQPGFELGEGDEPVVETLAGDAGYALVGAEDIIASAPAPLASIRDQVASDWRARQARDRARAVATAIAAKVGKGGTMQAAVAEAGVRLPAPGKVARRRIELSQFQGRVPAAMGMMFSLAEGRSRMIADPEGRGFVVVKVTKITPGNASLQPSLISRTQSEFQEAAGNEYAQQMAKAIEAAVGVKRDDKAIEAARKRIVGGGN